MQSQDVSQDVSGNQLFHLGDLINNGEFAPALLLIHDNHAEYLKILMSRDSNNTLLHTAILQNKFTETLIIVREYKQHIDHPNQTGQTALMFAAFTGNLPIMKLLIRNGANVNVCDKFNFSALLYAVKSKMDFAAIYLISEGASLSVTDVNNCSILHWAAYQNNVNLLILFVRHFKLDITAKDWQQCNPLMRAMKNCSYSCVKFLLEYLLENPHLILQVLPDTADLSSIESPYIKKLITQFMRDKKKIAKVPKQIRIFLVYSFVLIGEFIIFRLSEQQKFEHQVILNCQIIFCTLSLLLITAFMFERDSVPTSYRANDRAQKKPLNYVDMHDQEHLELKEQFESSSSWNEDELPYIITKMINENRFHELNQLQNLNYQSLTIMVEREVYWQQPFIFQIVSEQTQQCHKLFCFYSDFFEKAICLDKYHKKYIIIQLVLFTSILLTLGCFYFSLGQNLEANILYWPFELMIVALKLSPLDALIYIALVVLAFTVGLYLSIFILCIITNLTYYELVRNENCPYLFDNVQPHARSNILYKLFKNPIDRGLFVNIKSFLIS